MSLGLDIAHAAGAFRLELRETIPPGFTAIVGPSGSGKTTMLNVIAGLTRPERAVVTIDDEVLADSGRGIWVPPYERRIGYVFQEPRLFPHLTVRQNLLYGRWAARRRADEVAEDEVIGLLNLRDLLSRRPSRLSGGEQQRVALGRALLSNPRLLLLDEPLASVDQEHRLEILPYLDRFRADHRIPALYVTHTWSEVAARANHVVTLRAGRVVPLAADAITSVAQSAV